MRQILFIMIGASLLLHASFSRNSNGMVVDSITGLAWQDDYSDNINSVKKANWQGAIIYCEELSFGGESDWRLPNIRELKSIVDDTKYDPAINAIFANVISGYYWSSTTVIFDSPNAWNVYFYLGVDNWNTKMDELYVRCVRGGL